MIGKKEQGRLKLLAFYPEIFLTKLAEGLLWAGAARLTQAAAHRFERRVDVGRVAHRVGNLVVGDEVDLEMMKLFRSLR